LKRYEKESLIKNFLVFFSLLEVLLLLLFLEHYQTKIKDYKQNMYKTMLLCSYTLKCNQFTFNFVPKLNTKHDILHEDNGLYSAFPIPKSEKYNIQINYSKDAYRNDIYHIQKHHLLYFSLMSLILCFIALFFTFYSLSPIRQALKLNDEFIKDILHDFNTPITSMVLNIQMHNKAYPINPFIKRISVSIDTIVHLQNNLKSFLHHSPTQNSEININKIAKERLYFIQNIYPNLQFNYEEHTMMKYITNKELLTRILDNILNNAAKYNKPNGKVTMRIKGTQIIIEDTGKGIKNIHKVMERYHKEQSRGLGLGLHIVKKLTTELNIKIDIESKENIGTTVILDLKHLPEHNKNDEK
jgi:signal transduction histidine kinase